MFDTLWVSQQLVSLLLSAIAALAESRLALINNPESVQSESETQESANGSESKSRPRPFETDLQTKTSLKYDNTTSGIYCAWPQHSVLACSDTSAPSNPGGHMSSSLLGSDDSTTVKSWTLSTRLLTAANKGKRIPAGAGQPPAAAAAAECALFFFFFTLPFLSLTGGSSVSSLIPHQKVRPTSQLIAPDAGKQATKTSWLRKTASGQKLSRHLKSSFFLCWFVFVTIIYIWPKNEIRWEGSHD